MLKIKTIGSCLFLTFLLMLGLPAHADANAQQVEFSANETVFHAIKSIAAQPFDRIAAFTLTYAILSDAKIDADEKMLLSALADANTQSLKVKGPDATLVSLFAPDANARHAFGLLSASKNLNEYWLQGEAAMTDLVTLAYLSDAAWARVSKFIASKFYADWQNSNLENGYKPIRDRLAEAYELGVKGTEDALIGNAKSALFYDAMQMVDQHAQDAIPDFIYSWLQHGNEFKPFARAPLPVKAEELSPEEQMVRLHNSLGKIIAAPSKPYFMQPMYSLTNYVGEQCNAMIYAEATLFVTQYYQIMFDYRGLKDVTVLPNEKEGGALLKIDGQCAVLAYDAGLKVGAYQGAYADCAAIKIDARDVAGATLFGQTMLEVARACKD